MTKESKFCLITFTVFTIGYTTTCLLDSWEAIEVTRATGKAPEADSMTLKVRMGEGGSP